MSVCPAKLRLAWASVWSETLLCAQWVAKDLSFLHTASDDSDQTGRMPRLICLRWALTHFVGFVMSWLVYSLMSTTIFRCTAFGRHFVFLKGKHVFILFLARLYEVVPVRIRICITRSRHTATKFYFQVFQKFVSWQPLIRKHSYLDYRYIGGPVFIPWFLTPGLMPLGGARGQNLGHL